MSEKKLERSPGNGRTYIVQFGSWHDSFSALALCSLLSYSALFQLMTARAISELYYNIWKLKSKRKWIKRSIVEYKFHYIYMDYAAKKPTYVLLPE